MNIPGSLRHMGRGLILNLPCQRTAKKNAQARRREKRDQVNDAVTQFLACLTPDEKTCLKNAFYAGMVVGEWDDNYVGYTLLGDKPLSNSLPATQRDPADAAFLRLVQKHQPRLNSGNYFISHFINSDATISFGPELTLIGNKRAIRQAVQKHIDLFKRELGNTVTPDEIIKSIQEGSELAIRTLQNMVLRGILLGYGREGSQMLARFRELKVENQGDLHRMAWEGQIQKRYRPHLYHGEFDYTVRTNIPPSPGFDTTQAEFDHIRLNLRECPHKRYLPGEVSDVEFASVKNSSEAEALFNHYRKVKPHIQRVVAKIHNEDEFLRCLLKKFLAPPISSQWEA